MVRHVCQEFLKDILFAAITAAVPVLTAYIVVLIRTEAAEAIAAAVAATNQTYVDALKNAGKFDAEAQKQVRKRR